MPQKRERTLALKHHLPARTARAGRHLPVFPSSPSVQLGSPRGQHPRAAGWHRIADVNNRGTLFGGFSGLSAPISGLLFLFVPNLQKLPGAATTEKALDRQRL